eukprot:CAMPEP_0194066540 /NCGR_PEP_ID=MMETSP0009_2-20130614/86078_1 /TAXON_ID=210454 /ORGANISM="Grammatophora oceanica, Strain CCMP 410" /LENGTH=117 /DNA_ID=CAMNT_0038719505 /DNA_START=671 /DNA_END=1024 /DNA_ORIENTATION=-
MTVVIGKQQAWHGPRGSHIELRRSTVRKILTMLREKHPGNDTEKRLPRIAKSLEYRLYLKAETKAQYTNPQTLKKRLRMIVREVYASAGQPLPIACDDEPNPTLIQTEDEETGTVRG